MLGAKGTLMLIPSYGFPANRYSGSDLMLLNLAKKAFEKAKWPTRVSTGRYAFGVGDGVRNVMTNS